MANENALVVYGENGEILDCKFERVNFDEPATLLSYCQDVKDAIGEILDRTAQMAVDSQETQVDDEMIQSIVSFDQSLDESEKEKNKKQLPIIRGIKGALAKIGVEKFKEEKEKATYKGRFEAYCSEIERVVSAVESQMEGSKKDIQLRDDIIKELQPLIEGLEEMIKVGHVDKEAFDKTIEALKALPEKDMDTEHEITYKSQLSDVFGAQLDSLGKALVLYKEQVQTYRLQQKTDMELVMTSDAFIRDSAPILKAQGSVMVFNRQQQNRINSISSLTEATNLAIRENAKELEQNAQAAVELSLNKGVSVETLQVVSAHLDQGRKIFVDGNNMKKQQIEGNKKALLELNDKLGLFQQELLHLVDDEDALAEVLGTSKPTSLSTRTSYQKKLGTITGSKK